MYRHRFLSGAEYSAETESLVCERKFGRILAQVFLQGNKKNDREVMPQLPAAEGGTGCETR